VPQNLRLDESSERVMMQQANSHALPRPDQEKLILKKNKHLGSIRLKTSA
jgi:hypothetical protein